MPHLRLLSTILALGLALAGCAGLPVSTSLPAGITTTPVATVDTPLFAVDNAGERIAFVRQGLRIGDVSRRSDLPVDNGRPTAIAWAPDGNTLAAAFSGNGKSEVRLYAKDGGTKGAIQLDGSVGSLAWRAANDLLIASVVMSNYKFGSDYQQILSRWDGAGQPVSVKLHNATLRPGTARMLGSEYARPFMLAVSPLGDTIAYTRQHDPPEFATYLRVMLRHLETGSEREVANIAQDSPAPQFIAGDDRLLLVDGKQINIALPWSGEPPTHLPQTGHAVIVAPGGSQMVVDGQLSRANQPLAGFPATVTGSFADSGSRLFLLHRDTIYLVNGLSADPAPAPPADQRQKLLQLRALRSQGLITQADFLKAAPQ